MKNVIVIGAGLSGLTCSVKLAQHNVKVKLFSPSSSEQAQSVMAMGGINAALNTKGQNDSVKEHYTDTINGGQDINNHNAVRKLTSDAPDIIRWLSDIGCSFSRDHEGNVDLRYFGGQKKMRTAYAGAKTGKQIITAVNSQCRRFEASGLIERFIGWRLLSLIIKNSQCTGAIMLNEYTNDIKAFSCDYVVLATGGMNKIFGKTSGSIQNDGCATALAFMQNVNLANLEMIQFHPTTIKTPVKPMLITEAARAEGGRLYTIRDDERWYFMEEWYPEFGALMPRDVVSRSIYKVCHEYNLGIDGEEKVYLDISHLDDDTIKSKLDEVYEVCGEYINLDVTEEPIPVYPGVHYFMGGIWTDENHKTSIDGLYAVGECSSQYHGANRLGGNSLLGAIHGGWIASEQIIHDGRKIAPDEDALNDSLEKELEKYNLWQKIQEENNITSSYEIEDEITSIMREAMGIYRSEEQLTQSYGKLEKLEWKLINSHRSYYEYIRIHALIKLSEAMIKSALERKESRGSHQRIEYPDRLNKFNMITMACYDNDDIKITFEDTDKESWW